jgi:hypothetical protein
LGLSEKTKVAKARYVAEGRRRKLSGSLVETGYRRRKSNAKALALHTVGIGNCNNENAALFFNY